jgi:hypothetical protein
MGQDRRNLRRPEAVKQLRSRVILFAEIIPLGRTIRSSYDRLRTELAPVWRHKCGKSNGS